MINTQSNVQGVIQPVSTPTLQGGLPVVPQLSRPFVNTLPQTPALLPAPKPQYLSANLDEASKIVGTDIDQYVWGDKTDNKQTQKTKQEKNQQTENFQTDAQAANSNPAAKKPKNKKTGIKDILTGGVLLTGLGAIGLAICKKKTGKGIGDFAKSIKTSVSGFAKKLFRKTPTP